MKTKYRVGQKVRLLDGSHDPSFLAGWVSPMSRCVGKVFEIAQIINYNNKPAYILANCAGWKWDQRYLEPVSNTIKVVITTNGATTKAVMYDGKMKVKEAMSKCHENDRFDLGEGAVLAVNRLFGRNSVSMPADKNPSKPATDTRLLNCKICITSGEGVILKKGHIYEIKAGKFTNGNFPSNGVLRTADDLRFYLSNHEERLDMIRRGFHPTNEISGMSFTVGFKYVEVVDD